MRVLFICDEYPPGKSGGIGTAVQVMAREMVKQKHDVWVTGLYSYTYGGKDFETDFGVNVIRQRYGPKLNSEGTVYKAYKKMPALIRRKINGQKAFKKFTDSVSQLILQHNIQIIEIADWNTFAMHIGFLVTWPKFNVPLVVKAHGSYSKINYDLNKKINKRFFEMDKCLYQRADAICAVSEDTAKTIKQLFDIKKEIKITYNGINFNDQPNKASRDNNKIMFAGSLTQQKGIYQLIKAWNEVSLKMPKLKLYVYGKGKVEPLKLLLQAQALPTVEFKGYISRENLMSEFATAALTVLPSYSETFGLTAVEAMGAGCPVIFTKRACGTEIVEHGVNGYLVEPDNISEISSAILKLMNDDVLRHKFSENGKASVEQRFDIKELTYTQINYFEEVISQFGR